MSAPIVAQPGGPPAPGLKNAEWMAKPQGLPGCPPGLEYLTQLDQVLVHQVIELAEVLTGFETKNRYAIKNSLGQQVFFAMEESSCLMRNCCQEHRGFILHLTDNFGQEVIRVSREFKCCAGCCWCADTKCCAYEVVIESPPGTPVGYMRQSQTCWKPFYQLLDANHKPVFDIRGPCCPCQTICCTEDVRFEIFTAETQQNVGTISKQWAGWFQEVCTKANNFSVEFPMDLDVKVKAALIGGVFLVDFMFFEHPDN
ncbi:phospholipid scramblase 1-like [Anneissia japonica]|uniref:phospholipid scramblase 1-like n=1 Tax=Anneissia japonica TaxID=1529436 RepID=UPI0014259BDB|nr:phospholipid scramblase 1-like [Anneissia japonica]XP_033107264.1 phospholipid scramblase 1-like [Anneissia japonica]